MNGCVFLLQLIEEEADEKKSATTVWSPGALMKTPPAPPLKPTVRVFVENAAYLCTSLAGLNCLAQDVMYM